MNIYKGDSGQDIVYKDYSTSELGLVMFDSTANPITASSDLQLDLLVRPESVLIKSFPDPLDVPLADVRFER